jgi:Tfp pilus assembly protein PilF
MKPRYTPRETRQVMSRWAVLLLSCFALTLVLNVSFSQYLLERREGDPDTHLNLAETLKNAKDFTGAKVSVENALDRAPLYPRAHKVLGDILFDQGAWAEAEVAYQRCLDLGGKYEGVQNNLLWSLIEQESYETTISLGKRFLEQGDVSYMVPRYIAEACMRSGRWNEAVDYLKLALEYNPKETGLLRRLAIAYGELEMKAEEKRVLAILDEVEMALEKEQQLSQLPAR